jgi:hypothetical protein
MKTATWVLLVAGGTLAMACGGDDKKKGSSSSNTANSSNNGSNSSSSGGSSNGTSASGTPSTNSSSSSNSSGGTTSGSGGTTSGSGGSAGENPGAAGEGGEGSTDAGTGGSGGNDLPSQSAQEACDRHDQSMLDIAPEDCTSVLSWVENETCIGAFEINFTDCEEQFIAFHDCLATAEDRIMVGASCSPNLSAEACMDQGTALMQCSSAG